MELDGFRIGELRHKGGMARLWSVTRPDIAFPMLMKVPSLAEGEDPAAIVGFEMEQMILPRLTGPHVPRFVAAGDFTLQPYLVMEAIEGASLFPQLDRLPLPIDEIAQLGIGIAAALADLHRQQVIHLDVKPSNILQRPDGRMALIDFGLSRHRQLPDLMEEEFRLPYGTAPYIAPEQVLRSRREPRSDLFALGALLYFFTTGRRPFGNPRGLRGLRRRLWRDPVPPRALRADCPLWLQDIILRCLSVDPADRHPTAAQLVFDLRAPDQIPLTARAGRLRADGWLAVLHRRFRLDPAALVAAAPPVDPAAAAPILLVAIDLAPEHADLAGNLRVALARLLPGLPRARIACLNVLKQSRISLDTTLDAAGRNKHVQRLVALKHWAEPLGLGADRLTFHVLEAVDPAAAILDYARANQVDHILLGARAASTLRSLLGGVSGAVAAHAPCTVTIVRQRAAAESEAPDDL